MIMNSKFTILLAVASALLFNVAASSQTIPVTKIAVVDNRLVGSNSAVAKDITRQVTQFQTEMQNELAATESVLAAEQESLKGQSAIMPQEAYNLKAEEFQRKLNAYRLDVNTKQRQLEIAIANANAAVTREIKPIYQSILQTTGATILMDKTMVLEQVPGIDVTTMVIEQLDIKLPSVKVELPPVPEVPAAATAAPATN